MSPKRALSRSDPTSPPDASTLRPGLRLLPERARADVYRLYNVLRTLDDLVDDGEPEGPARIAAVERWTRHEEVDSPETRALDDLCGRTGLTRAPLMDFCRGMSHDIEHAAVEDEEDLELYCQRAGGSVGIMLAQLLGTSHPDAETKMAALGRAMQRTNILRDIDEDAAHGRVYISMSTIDRFGPPTPGARAELLRDQIDRADRLYEQAWGAMPLLARGRIGMSVCTGLYREILRQIEREGFGAMRSRVVVPAWRRRLLVVRLLAHAG